MSPVNNTPTDNTSGFGWFITYNDNSETLYGLNTLPNATCGCPNPSNDTFHAFEGYVWNTKEISCIYTEYLEGSVIYRRYANTYSIISTNIGGVENAFFFVPIGHAPEPAANNLIYNLSTVHNLTPVNEWSEEPVYPIKYESGSEPIKSSSGAGGGSISYPSVSADGTVSSGNTTGTRYCAPLDYETRPPIIYFDCVITAHFHNLNPPSGTPHGDIDRTFNITIGVAANWSSRSRECLRGMSNYNTGTDFIKMQYYKPDPWVEKNSNEWESHVNDMIANGGAPQTKYEILTPQEWSQLMLDKCKIRPC